MNLNVVITPKYSEKEIFFEGFTKSFTRFEGEMMLEMEALEQYMKSYINANRKREGGTGKLAGAMRGESMSSTSSAGAAAFGWGIGNLTSLQSEAPYWKAVNFGGIVPNYGLPTPGHFSGMPPDPSKRGHGTEKFTMAKNTYMMQPGVMRPMNYIEAGYKQLTRSVNFVLARLKGV